MDQQFRGDEGGGEGEGLRGHGWERGDGAVGEGVWQRAEADHAEEAKAVVLEDEGEGGEAGVVGGEAVDEGGEEVAGGEEGEGRAEDGGGGDDEPAGVS